jgi:hypothetical protein
MRRGTRAGQAYVAVTADGSGINEGIVDSVDEAGPGVERVGEQHGERYGEKFGDGFRGRLDGIRGKLGKVLVNRLGNEGEEAGERFADRVRGTLDRAGDKIGNSLGERISESMTDILEESFARLIDTLEERLTAVSRNGGPRKKTEEDSGGIGDLIGRLTGAGSRNNFLNLLGRTLGGVATLTERASKFATGFASGMSNAAEGASLVQRALSGLQGAGAASGLTKIFSGIIKSGPAAVAALAAVAIAMSVLASVAGALLGILTAMAATITSALVGALAVGAAGFAAMAAAAGLLTAAFMSMTDAQQALLSDAFQPLKAEMVGLGQLMIQEMVPYFGVWSSNLQRALLLVLPVAQVMGETFGRAGAIMTEAFSGPGFQLVANALAIYLPTIVLRLTRAFGSFLNGVSGVFAALMPLVNRFSAYLADVADRFSRWANSAQGQNAIVDFANRAVDALGSLWNFVREFSGFVFDVLFNPASQRAGNTIFDGLANAFARFRRKIDDGSLERWFTDAIEFGGQLWRVIEALGRTFIALYNSGVLSQVGDALGALAEIINLLNNVVGPTIELFGGPLVAAISAPLSVIGTVSRAMDGLIDKLGGLRNIIETIAPLSGLIGKASDALGNGGSSGGGYNPITDRGGYGNGLGVLASNQTPSLPSLDFNMPDLDALISSGNAALNATSQSSGGYKPPKEPKKWKNPYVDWALSLIKEGPTERAKIRTMLKEMNEEYKATIQEWANETSEMFRDIVADVSSTVRDAVVSTDAAGVSSAFASLVENIGNQMASASASMMADAQTQAANMRSTAQSSVDSAQANVNAAAQRLASASTKKEADRALKELKQAQKTLEVAKNAQKRIDAEANRLIDEATRNAVASQDRINMAQSILAGQAVFSQANAEALANGLRVENATLADYAAAREIMASWIDQANQKLADAISMRDQYAEGVTSAAKTFGALTTAQAQVINGVSQALTADDITNNLQDRLDKIRKFQENLRILLAQGLSDEAYKQIVDAGVEGGSAYAQALVNGGQGAISQVNNLTGQYGDLAEQLGTESASRLYQAGVDAAQGLVDGLTSMSEQLDTAATRLGETIANAVKRSLGIASPSRVMRGMMGNVGDGVVLGLDDQGAKVDAAAVNLANRVAVSPEVAQYAARQGEDPVSGNGKDPRFRDLIIQTPTEDPEAVAMEVLNEVTGRL